MPWMTTWGMAGISRGNGRFSIFNSRRLPERHRAGLVIWLPGMRIEGRMREPVHLRVVHRQEDLTGLHRRRDVNGCLQLSAARTNPDHIVFLQAETGGILRVDLDIDSLGIQLPQDVRFGRAALGVPLA